MSFTQKTKDTELYVLQGLRNTYIIIPEQMVTPLNSGKKIKNLESDQ